MSDKTRQRVWDGPRLRISKLNQEHSLVQLGWWLEPEARFVPIMDKLTITGSASPVYAELSND